MLPCLWLTDLHVDRLSKSQWNTLIERIVRSDAGQLWLTGDIGDPPYNWRFLEDILSRLTIPVYFVLGNHDYYHLSLHEARRNAHAIMSRYPHAFYLTMSPVTILDDIMVAGVDAWANTNHIPLTRRTWDADAINDWQSLSLPELKEAMNGVAQEDAMALNEKCDQAIHKNIRKVYLLTHIPPLEAAHAAGSKQLQGHGSVYYSAALSKVLNQLSQRYKEVTFEIYSGHVHRFLEYRIADNMTGYVAPAYRPTSSFSFNWVTL